MSDGGLKADNICFSRGNFSLENISLETRCGEFLGIAGPNGCGKTTLLNILSGLLPAQRGAVSICGEEILAAAPERRAALCAFLPAEISASADFTARETAVMGRSPALAWWRDYSAEDYGAVSAALKSVGLDAAADKPVNFLSTGERRKVFIAQTLCQAAPVLILDEPTAHLDLKCQLEIFGLLRETAKKQNRAVIAVSHDISMLLRFCDTVLLLKHGRRAAYGPPEKAVDASAMREVYGVDAEICRDGAGSLHLLAKNPVYYY
ncbi:MAG: ABC transporter ATP-binding protein [Elusimicrobiales bacterium]